MHHGGVLTNKGSPSPSRMYYLVGNYSPKSIVAGCVKRLYLRCVFELLGAFEISQICSGSGVGRSTILIQVKLYCLRMIKIVLAFMYAHLF